MADSNQTKASRRQASAHATKAERKQAKLRRRQQESPVSETDERTAPADADSGGAIEGRLARLEEAVATQSELSEKLLAKLDEVLHEARKSSRHAKAAVTQPGEEGGGASEGI